MSARDYEMPWRPTYEFISALGWGGSALATGGIAATTALPMAPFAYMTLFTGGMALNQLYKAWQHRRISSNLCGRPLTFMDIGTLFNRCANGQFADSLWLGRGFEWGQRHTQRVYEITKRDMETKLNERIRKRYKGNEANIVGKLWIHGVEPSEHDITVPLKHLQGHTIVFGTTSAGKTRLFDLMITQAIARGETVIIVDPKGDKELMLNAMRACHFAGRPEAFVHFNPAFPSRSARIDPMKNWNRSTELASRVKDLITSDAETDPFAQFSWNAINNIVQGLIATGVRPNLKRLRQYIEGGPARLLSRALRNHFDDHVSDWSAALASKLQKARDSEAETKILVQFYKDYVSERHPSQALNGLIKMFEHERAHFSKMVASLEPILNQLTSGELGELLSPDAEDIDDIRPITDSARMINAGQVVYLGLDSLSDGTVGSAIGSIMLADLTAVAGDRYNYGVDNRPVNLYVDEAAEVVNKPLIQLMNKGRGAGFSVTIASQTFPDFSARLGDESKSRQVIGNANNLIGLRVIDGLTQEFITEPLGETTIRQIMHTQNTSAMGGDKDPTNFSGGYGERLIEADVPLFSSNLLGNLPNLEYIASLSGGRIFKGRLPIVTSDMEMSLDHQPWLHADDD